MATLGTKSTFNTGLEYSQANLANAQAKQLGASTQLQQQLFQALFGGQEGLFSGLRQIFQQGGEGFGVGGDAAQSLLGQLGDYGKGQTAVINQGFSDLSNSTAGKLAASNLATDTILPSVLSGIERQRQLSLGALGDTVIGKKIDVQENALNRQIQGISSIAQLLGGFS